MSPERFERIEELYHAAREAAPEARAALLADVDTELRRAVELLLSQSSGGDFLVRPAVANAAELLDDPTVTGLPSGFFLGPYRIESKLGEGGMGEVFRAFDTRLGRVVAIKTTKEQFSLRFEREARTIASLNHPNICTVHDVGPNYLVMELVEGESMAELLKRGPLPMNTALAYASQIAAALVEAHAKGIVHRDLKPGNIMIGKSGVKVLDFGLARSGQDETITGSHMVLGTPAYMAPEQREGKAADARSDIYSLGRVLYEMFTGMRASAQRRRIPSPKLDGIVSRCLEEDPARRWQTAAELGRELAGAGSVASRGRSMLPAAVCLFGLVAAAAYFYLHRGQKLTDQDTIVLADFVNNTSDPIFDGTLRQGLAIQLEQSPFLKIMDDQQMQGVLKLMSLPPGSRISNSIAHQICVRDGAAATIDGAIASLGTIYAITLQAVACADGKTLAREQAQASDKEHVLNALGSAATALRGKLGESHKSIQKLNRPLEEVTTPSLEALQKFTVGVSAVLHGDSLAAVQPLEQATVIDPNFAMAYYYLAVAFDAAGDDTRARGYLKKALSLSERVSELERDQIVTTYYFAVGDLDKAIEAYKSGISVFPQFCLFHNGLADTYIAAGQYEEGLKEGLEAARLEANVEQPYRRQLDAYMCLDRLPEARKLAGQLRAQGLGGARIHQRFLELAYIEGDQAAADREIQWFVGKPEEYLSLALQAANRNVHGERQASRTLYQQAEEKAKRRKLRNVASELEEADARADELLGNCQTVGRLGRPALAVAMCGNAVLAEKLAAETSKAFPDGTAWNAVQLPEILAANAYYRGQPEKSVNLLKSATQYERAYLETVYLRGLAFLRMKKGAEAAAEFRKIVDHKGVNWAGLWRSPYWGQFYSLSYLGIARGSALAGDRVKAQKAFEDFFELWKNPDTDIKIFKDAHAEYAKLR